jgi:hypothetical protein
MMIVEPYCHLHSAETSIKRCIAGDTSSKKLRSTYLATKRQHGIYEMFEENAMNY